MSNPIRAVAFFDGQNLYRCAKAAFGYTFPNYDPVKLARYVCCKKGWDLELVKFYTGVPKATEDQPWNTFWTNKLATLGRQPNVTIFKRDLAQRLKEISTPTGMQRIPVHVEKGIDVRIAIDMITMARSDLYDAILVFSQDQDLSEAAKEIKVIASEKRKFIHIASSYPENTNFAYSRGINSTEWIKFSKTEYDLCIDPNDYR